MPIYELTHDAIVPVDQQSFASLGVKERQDLQRILRANIGVVSPDTYVLAEEYGEWEDSKRSIDLLGLDKNADLVVIELKRTEDGGHMELQAIRYAAMVSKMTYAQAVDAHTRYLKKIGQSSEAAEEAILKFLGWDEPQQKPFAKNVRIVLVSANFSKEITTSVIWLNERDVDVRCVRLRPYRLGDKTLLDIQQALPLPEAADYQVQIRLKAAEERQSEDGGSDWTRYDLVVGDKKFSNLWKRHLFLRAIRAFADNGISIDELMQFFPARKFLGIPGKLTSVEFQQAAANIKNSSGAPYDLKRRFMQDDELIYCGGKTWALSNQWSRYQIPDLDDAIAKYPNLGMSYVKTTDDDEASQES
jgi:hypothetical protein